MQGNGIEADLLLFDFTLIIAAYVAPAKAKQISAITSTAVTIGNIPEKNSNQTIG